MLIYKKELKDIWLKAAVAGSLWGSTEIIVGSFFHNIKMPMSGTILAVLGVSLMTAFGQIWKDKGLFWRAGLIAAVMKSVSPSAVLLGPMTGIFLEALLFEAAVRILGQNNFAYLTGSILALYSVVIHKVITLILIYGTDLIKITQNFYFFITKQLKTDNLDFKEAVFILSLLYVLFGIFAAVSGIIIGKKAVKQRDFYENDKEIEIENKKDSVKIENDDTSLTMLFFHLILIISVLILSGFISVLPFSLITVAYVTFTLFKYKRSLRYFKKPGFWIQIAIFVFISILFYNGINKDNFFSEEGVDAGIKMGLRAIFVVIGFSAVSSELRNPLIKILLYRKGFVQFYSALSSAFSVLPYLMKHSANPKHLIKNPKKTLINNILDAELIFKKFKKEKRSKYAVIISGKKHTGKTSFAEKIIMILKNRGFSTAGFTAPGKFSDNKRSEFSIKDIKTGETEILCGINPKYGNKKTGRFYFSDKGLKFGKDILKPENISGADFVLIDELGPFELKGKGWSRETERILNTVNGILPLFTVRENLIYDILRRFGITEALILETGKDTPEESVTEILNFRAKNF